MRLTSFLNENVKEIPNVYELNKLIQKDCKPYLNLLKGADPLYRGIEDMRFDLGVKQVRKDREAMGMESWAANILNKWLQDNGHVRRDKSVFASSNGRHVELFGNAFYIFPMGNIKYTWIETTDINLYDYNGWEEDTVGAWAALKVGKEKDEKVLNHYKEILNKLKKPFEKWFHTNEGFNTAYKKGYEIWIDCKSYYFASSDFYLWDKDKLWKIAS